MLHQQAGHMKATDLRNMTEKPLPKARPYMNHILAD